MAELDAYIRAHLKPRHLQLLVALDDFHNLGKVAAITHVTQPAVSKTLADLERGLGLKLFDRTARGVEPTAYGRCLIRHARTVLNDLNQARDELRDLMSGASGKIVVGSLPTATSVLLARSLTLLKRRSPGTSVALREGTMERLMPELRQGRLDVIVGRLPNHLPVSGLGTKTLSEAPVSLLVARRDHPLSHKKTLGWSNLKDFPWVLPPIGSLLREPLERALERYGVPMPSNHIETLYVPLVVAYVQLTDAIAIMAGDVSRHYQDIGALSILPLELPRLFRPLGITWNRERPLSPGTELLVQCLEEVARGDKVAVDADGIQNVA